MTTHGRTPLRRMIEADDSSAIVSDVVAIGHNFLASKEPDECGARSCTGYEFNEHLALETEWCTNEVSVRSKLSLMSMINAGYLSTPGTTTHWNSWTFTLTPLGEEKLSLRCSAGGSVFPTAATAPGESLSKLCERVLARCKLQGSVMLSVLGDIMTSLAPSAELSAAPSFAPSSMESESPSSEPSTTTGLSTGASVSPSVNG